MIPAQSAASTVSIVFLLSNPDVPGQDACLLLWFCHKTTGTEKSSRPAGEDAGREDLKNPSELAPELLTAVLKKDRLPGMLLLQH
jgi:hypothetical protein